MYGADPNLRVWLESVQIGYVLTVAIAALAVVALTAARTAGSLPPCTDQPEHPSTR